MEKLRKLAVQKQTSHDNGRYRGLCESHLKFTVSEPLWVLCAKAVLYSRSAHSGQNKTSGVVLKTQ